MNRVKALLIALTLIGSVFITACRKSGEGPDTKLYGLSEGWWQSIPEGGERHLNFYKDSVTIAIIYYGKSLRTEYKGYYTRSGNSLDIDIKNVLELENGKLVSTTPFIGKMYENATYSINGTRLNLNYTRYEANVPVATTSVFMRVPED